jgi:acyl dehydratase
MPDVSGRDATVRRTLEPFEIMSNNVSSESQQLAALKGHRLGPYLSHNPVSATQIWQWCAVMGDDNPLYRPGATQLAPPAMMQMWTMRDFYDRYAPGSTDEPPYRVFENLAAMGYPANVAVSYDIIFHHYLRVGERARHYTSVVDISERKTTALGLGYFVTERVEYLTHDETPFAEARITYFQYQPRAANGGQDNRKEPSAAAGELVQEHAAIASSDWRPDYRDVAISSLHVGDPLPELVLPITHRLIVAGAIATQDFIPVHHNLPAARAAGMPDIFMNILTTSGLSVRYLTDWAGSGARLKTLRFNLMAPNMPGDVMVMAGELTAIDPQSSGALVTVSFVGKNRLGIHTSGTATLALPNSTE